jgi:hypothetical protein
MSRSGRRNEESGLIRHFHSVVIPAKAGIHLDLALSLKSKMDSRFRGNDVKKKEREWTGWQAGNDRRHETRDNE